MELEIKKNLASNWFKMLQDSICHDINDLEKSHVKFKSTNWKRNSKKNEGGGEYRILKMEEFLIKLELTSQKFMENFQNNYKKKFQELKKIPDSGRRVFQS